MFTAGSARSRQSYARPPATQQNGQHDVSEVAPSEAKKPGGIPVPGKSWNQTDMNTWVKVFRIIPEFRILTLTFHRKSASKC